MVLIAGVLLGCLSAVLVFMAWPISAVLCIASPLVACLSIVALLRAARMDGRLWRSRRRSLIYVGGGLLLVSMQLAPAAGMYASHDICALLHSVQDSGSTPTICLPGES
jgi:hypothetical protein